MDERRKHQRTEIDEPGLVSAGGSVMRCVVRNISENGAHLEFKSLLGLPKDSALALFLLGRTVGWIAHALEQSAHGALIRPRARYIGPRPEAGGDA